jgi:hypothetical protein
MSSGSGVVRRKPRRLRGRIERLVYDRLGRVIGFRLVDQPDVIAASREMEASLEEAFAGGLSVTPIVDPNTGELELAEIG